jgi:hypothetical protein
MPDSRQHATIAECRAATRKKSLIFSLKGAAAISGEVEIIGSGKHAYLRICLLDGPDSEIECAWADNGPELRSWLEGALKRTKSRARQP